MARIASAFLLVLMLALTAQAQATARGAMAGAQAGMGLVICTEAGLEAVTLGADGQPVGSRHYCPDCLPGLSAALAPANAPTPGATLHRVPLRHSLAEVAALPADPVLSPLPRGPPGRV